MDHKHAGFRLWLQDKDMLAYHQQRFEFYDKVFLKRDVKPVSNFMSKVKMTIWKWMKNFVSWSRFWEKNRRSHLMYVFKKLYAKVYKEHYTDIMEQIETFAAYGTPIDTVFYIDTGANTQGEF